MNFGAPKFEIRKYVLSQLADSGGSSGNVLSFLLSLLAPFALFRG
jgi:hypothetical protein